MGMIEVAKRAGVSTATVSRVLNSPERVRPETLRLVRRVMRELRYVKQVPGKDAAPRYRFIFFVPDKNEAAMRTGLTDRMLEGVSAFLNENDVELVLCNVRDWKENVLPPGMKPDGIIHKNYCPLLRYSSFFPDVPQVICLENELVPERFDQVKPDVKTLGKLALQYAVQRNYRHIQLLAPRNDPEASGRIEAIRHALQAAGLNPDARRFDPVTNLNEIHTPDDTELLVAAGRDDQLVKLFSNRILNGIPLLDRIDFLPVASDPAFGEQLSPRMNVLSFNGYELGYAAAELLLHRKLRPSAPPRRLLICPTLQIAGFRAENVRKAIENR